MKNFWLGKLAGNGKVPSDNGSAADMATVAVVAQVPAAVVAAVAEAPVKSVPLHFLSFDHAHIPTGIQVDMVFIDNVEKLIPHATQARKHD